MAYAGKIRFIFETQRAALVQGISAIGYSVESEGEHKLLRADFSGKNREDVVHYAYNAPSAFNDGLDVTLS